MKSSGPKELHFQSTITKLESLLDKMENSNMSLDQSLKAFEEGVRLTHTAQQHLSEVEQKVQLLSHNDDNPEMLEVGSTVEGKG